MGIGKEIDVGELGSVTTDKDNVLIVDKINDPTDLGRKIVDKILEGKVLVFHLSVQLISINLLLL